MPALILPSDKELEKRLWGIDPPNPSRHRAARLRTFGPALFYLLLLAVWVASDVGIVLRKLALTFGDLYSLTMCYVLFLALFRAMLSADADRFQRNWDEYRLTLMKLPEAMLASMKPWLGGMVYLVLLVGLSELLLRVLYLMPRWSGLLPDSSWEEYIWFFLKEILTRYLDISVVLIGGVILDFLLAGLGIKRLMRTLAVFIFCISSPHVWECFLHISRWHLGLQAPWYAYYRFKWSSETVYIYVDGSGVGISLIKIWILVRLYRLFKGAGK